MHRLHNGVLKPLHKEMHKLLNTYSEKKIFFLYSATHITQTKNSLSKNSVDNNYIFIIQPNKEVPGVPDPSTPIPFYFLHNLAVFFRSRSAFICVCLIQKKNIKPSKEKDELIFYFFLAPGGPSHDYNVQNFCVFKCYGLRHRSEAEKMR